MNLQFIISILISSTILLACSTSNKANKNSETSSQSQAGCSISEYAEYYYNTSQNPICGEKYEEDSKLYGFGDMTGSEYQVQVLERSAQANARMELGQKAAALQNKIKGSITQFENEDGSSGSSLMMEFDVQLTEVSEIESSCEEGDRGFVCYSLIEMPKSAVLESTASAFQKENEVLYIRWKDSEQYKSLLAELGL